MRLHVLGLPHTVSSKTFLPCAYTQKVLKFCRMMSARGHTVFHYGAEGADPAELGAEHIDVVFRGQQANWWPGFHMHDGFPPNVWEANAEWWRSMAAFTLAGLVKRYEPGDILCLIAGAGCHEVLWQMLQNTPLAGITCVEFGVGYTGVFCKNRVWESNAHRHFVHGRKSAQSGGAREWDDGSYTDTVIPNYFDPADFNEARNHEGYFLYLGRIIERKGVDTAITAARRLGVKLKIAGQGGRVEDGKLFGAGIEMPLGDDIDYLGTITDHHERAGLISGAVAMFVPTKYFEPFGGVFAEGLMSGVPVLTSDWGAFPEYVRQGLDGYRCNVLDDYLKGALNCYGFEVEHRRMIRTEAISRFGVEKAALQYEQYFERLRALREHGWNGKWRRHT